MKSPEGQEKSISWIRPNPNKEKGEVERVVKEFLNLEPTDENVNRLIEIIQEAPVVELGEEEWEQLNNTDSFHNVRSGHLEDAEEITEEYNQKLSQNNRRNFKKLLDSFTFGKEMEVPVIVKNKEGVTHLVSGNTRLMIARALGIKPKVIIVEI
ncbi:MAG: hypothetical protein A2836_00755 [Candidatus Taylorbacteria bacterium RIFCSPHIGHO2_01_FULL_45_63]|uniref:ParB/Sulfiredoxin domain-containing protein n=1 Tax=Candidatus Taylorbacteria bacterium RIFCSPHIGHO2_02_FULL_45_35 TaxID=1802311 RepID=A0A1G2MTE8_9BACT|nr:MAG: hypothetical protein A2836_00755 [Candidatus Taylorbacteria bacterium RIFCSPHIGHO2_01_FULL_45_63]OHA27148.1 MAG: hypothetical protein A3D56_03455 [Candidatus Taylorbacteria bacterium RIFCSPHIGHO2_02_FULL_45_35]OHA33848.1 MAG: hypothetical protein A3A22_01430 [Candidatus Taylorbacteria bacterium RIFCSPLOWO2_01_FULL_45_34b]